jgi:hypothetical protein
MATNSWLGTNLAGTTCWSSARTRGSASLPLPLAELVLLDYRGEVVVVGKDVNVSAEELVIEG